MQQMVDAVAEIVPGGAASVTDFRPYFSIAGITGDGRGGEGQR